MRSLHEGEWLREDSCAKELDEMEGWITPSSEQGPSRKARANERYQHQLILVYHFPCTRTI